jgi:hypothetical protein
MDWIIIFAQCTVFSSNVFGDLEYLTEKGSIVRVRRWHRSESCNGSLLEWKDLSNKSTIMMIHRQEIDILWGQLARRVCCRYRTHLQQYQTGCHASQHDTLVWHKQPIVVVQLQRLVEIARLYFCICAKGDNNMSTLTITVATPHNVSSGAHLTWTAPSIFNGNLGWLTSRRCKEPLQEGNISMSCVCQKGAP